MVGSKKSYWSKYRKLESTEDANLPITIKDLCNQIKCLKNWKLELSDKVHNFENKHLILFKKRQYSNYIRSAYEVLLGIGGIISAFQIALKKKFC